MNTDLFNYDHPEQNAADSLVILRGLDEVQWQIFVGFTEQLSFVTGQPILRAGDSGRTIYIVKAGRVQGSLPSGRADQAPLLMGPGSVFGELAFFDGAPRSASLWARDDVELWVLPFAAFEKLAAWHPRIARELLLDLGRVLAIRLRQAEARR